MRQSFYTSPVDHENLADWPKLARRLRRAAEKACQQGARVETPDEPVFGYGTDIEETLLGLEDPEFDPRAVRIELWCAIVHYGTICVTTGDAVVRKERRALERAVKKVLRGEVLIHESEKPFDRDERRIYGYRLDPEDDRDRSTLADLTIVFDPPHYLGERWILQDDDERIDEASYEVWPKSSSRHVRFLTASDGAAERAWSRAGLSEGLVVVDVDDPGIGRILQGFARTDDLRFLPTDRWQHRLTIGRCRPEDSLVVVYDSAALPSEDCEWVFVI